jgi:hypothetical protein
MHDHTVSTYSIPEHFQQILEFTKDLVELESVGPNSKIFLNAEISQIVRMEHTTPNRHHTSILYFRFLEAREIVPPILIMRTIPSPSP